MNTGSEEGWRIKVGACCFEDAKSALKLVKELTDTHIAELRGVLLEEEYLSGIELLPKQLVVTTSGSIEKIPSQKRINTIIAGEEAAFRDLLSKVSINLNWSFERRRGDLHSSILETDDGWDVLFVGCYELRKQTGEIVLIAPPNRRLTKHPV